MPKIVGYVGETPPTGEQSFPWLPTLAVFAGAYGMLWIASRLSNRLVANPISEFAPATLMKIREATRRARAGEAKIAPPAEIIKELSQLPPGRYTFDLGPDFDKREYWDEKLTPPGYRPKKWRRERWRRYKSDTTLRGAFLSASRAADGSDSRHVLVDTTGEPTGDAVSPYTAADPVVLGIYREDGEPVFLIHADTLTPPPELSKEARQTQRGEKKVEQEARKARRTEREAGRQTRSEKAAEKREQRRLEREESEREKEKARIMRAEGAASKILAKAQEAAAKAAEQIRQATAEAKAAGVSAPATASRTSRKKGAPAASPPPSPPPLPVKTAEELAQEKEAARVEDERVAAMTPEARQRYYARQLAVAGREKPKAAPAKAPTKQKGPRGRTAAAPLARAEEAETAEAESESPASELAQAAAATAPAKKLSYPALRAAIADAEKFATTPDEEGAAPGYAIAESLADLFIAKHQLTGDEPAALKKYIKDKVRDEQRAAKQVASGKPEQGGEAAAPAKRSKQASLFEEIYKKTASMGLIFPPDTLIGYVVEVRGGMSVTNFGTAKSQIFLSLALPNAKPKDRVRIIATRGEDGEIVSLRAETFVEPPAQAASVKGDDVTSKGKSKGKGTGKGKATSLKKNSRASEQDPALYKEFKRTINMSASEIERWRKNPQHRDASFPHIRAELPLLAEMKRTPMSKWTPKMWNKAMRAVNFVKRHEAQMKVQAKRYGTGRLHATYKRIIGLLNWGRKTPGVNIKKVLEGKTSKRVQPNVRVMRPQRFAAGMIVFAQSTGRMLLLLRSQRVSEPLTWDIPGGMCNSGAVDEPLLQCAIREFAEETQSPYEPRGPLSPFFVLNRSDLSYSTFIGYVPHEFEAELDWEHEGYGWFSLDSLPMPLHHGVQSVLEHAGYELARMQPKR